MTEVISPPALPGCAWRPAGPADLPAAARLLERCRAEGGPRPALDVDLACSVGAIGPDGELASLAWVEAPRLGAPEVRFYLHGAVRPEDRRRGAGTFLLAWSERRARELAVEREIRQGVLRIQAVDPPEGAVGLYERQGFALRHAEDEMRRDLRTPVSEAPLPDGLRERPWSETSAPAFYAAYRAAFRDRPGFPDWSEAVWRQAFTGDESFRPDLSRVIEAEDGPAGFLVAHVVPGAGWVEQMGVVPAWRGRGVGSALLAGALRRLQAEGVLEAALHVNVNNPGAARVYRRLGFEKVRCWTTYAKEL